MAISENSAKAALECKKQQERRNAEGGNRTLTLLPERDFESYRRIAVVSLTRGVTDSHVGRRWS